MEIKKKSLQNVYSEYDIELTISKMKETRLKAGLTQDDLARLLNVERTYIVKWESGKYRPGYDNLVRLYRVLHGMVSEK